MSNVFKTERGIKVNPRQCPCCKTMFDTPKKVSKAVSYTHLTLPTSDLV